MGVEYKDYYKLLEISRNATDEEIRKSYKKLARKYHPDLNPDNKQAEASFKDINEAYEVLKDPEKRKLYDQLGPNWQQGAQFGGQNFGGGGGSFNFGGSGGNFSDFFETIFGGMGGTQGFGADPLGGFGSRTRRGRDVESDLALTLEESVQGGTKTVTLNTSSGHKSLEVKIPAGVKDGARIRLSGQGEAAPAYGGKQGQPGDLYLKVKYRSHPNFAVDGNNIIHELPLAPWEAALGVKVQVPTLDGKVELNIPGGTSSGKKLRLRGKGLGSGSDKGDEMVQISIKTPAQISDEEKKLWEQLAELSTFDPRA